MPPVVSQILLDPEALAEAIQHATLKPCQLSAKPSHSRLTRVISKEVCLDYASLGPAMLFSGVMPSDCYTLVFVTECERKGCSFNFSTEHNDGYMGFFPPGGVVDAYTPPGYANATLTVPASVFESTVVSLYPEIPDAVLMRGGAMRIGAAEQLRLRALLKLVMQQVDDPSRPLAGEAVRQCLGIDLLEAFLPALSSGCASLVPPPGMRVAGRMTRIKRARDFLADHLNESLSLDALCREMGMSKRGVEQLFHDSMGIGPNAFLRHQRLHGARRALRSAPQESGIVKRIALDLGFWHMGHFARDYRSLFGESPSMTLSRANMNGTGRLW